MSEDDEDYLEFCDAVDRGFEAMSAPMVGVDIDVVLGAAEDMLTLAILGIINRGMGEAGEVLRRSLDRVHSNVMVHLGPLDSDTVH
jgi:hypothetical protein